MKSCACGSIRHPHHRLCSEPSASPTDSLDRYSEAADLLAFFAQDRYHIHGCTTGQSQEQQAMRLGTSALAACIVLCVKVHVKAINSAVKVHAFRQRDGGRFEFLTMLLCCHIHSPFQATSLCIVIRKQL